MMDFKEEKMLIRKLNKVIKDRTIFSWDVNVPIPLSEKRYEGERREIFYMKQKVSVFTEAVRFFLSVQNKKYSALPLRTCLEILWELEYSLKIEKGRKSFYFLKAEKNDYENLFDVVFTDDEKEDMKKIKHKKKIDKCKNSRIQNYEFYKLLCGISHGSVPANNALRISKEMHYYHFLVYMLRIQEAMIDLSFEVAGKYDLKNPISNKETLQLFEEIDNKIELFYNYLISSVKK